MTNGTSGRNTAIILAALVVLVVGAGLVAFLFFTGGEEPAPTAAPDPVGEAPAPATATTATATEPDSGSTPDAGPQETSGTAQTQVFLPGDSPLPQPSPPPQLGPLPVLPWQEDGLDELEAQVAESLAAIEQTDPATAHILADLPWLADEMLLSEAAAVFLVQEVGSIDPDLARQVANLPGLAELQLADDTVTTLLQLQDLVQADVETARQLLETAWLADGVQPADQATLAIVGGIAAEDPALARQVAAAPEIADGISPSELAALTGSDNYFLERLERDFPDIAEIVRGYSWVSGSVSRNLQDTGSGVLAYPLANQDAYDPYDISITAALRELAWIDASLAQQVAAFPWLADGVTTLELGAVWRINNIARRDLPVAKNIVALPWVADDITPTERSVLTTLNLFGSCHAIEGPALARLIASQSWFQDGISGRDASLTITLLAGCRYEGFCRQLIEEAHIRSETLTLPRGDVNIHLISRSPVGPDADQIFQWTDKAVAAVEEFLGLVWEPVNFSVYLEPEYQYISDSRGFYSRNMVVISDPNDRYVLYHELAHHYSRFGPYWLVEGGADFLTGYIYSIQEDATTDLQDAASYGFRSGMTHQARLAHLRQSQRNVMEEGFSCGNFPNIHAHNLHFQVKSPRYWFNNRSCSYTLGEHFLLTLYVDLGHDVVAPSLRELHQGAVEAYVEPGEEAIYQAFLSHTPPELLQEFEALYRLFHGRPDLVPTEVGGQTIELPDYHLDNSQAMALVELYVATDGPNWINNENWLSELPLSEWEGVTTDDDGNVFQLHLYDNDLSGPLPPELGNLANLWGFILGNNQLTGPIPPELGNLTELQLLDLSRNRLSGPLPTQLANLGELSRLNLHDNQLSGPFPPELARLSKLESLYIWESGLSGCIPDALANVPSNDFFEEGSLSPCGGEGALIQLAGDVETDRAALEAFYHATGGEEWANFPSSYWLSEEPLMNWYGVSTDRNGRVTRLVIRRSTLEQLTGNLPPELGKLTALRSLALSGNNLTGPIPPELGSLSNLRTLDLDGNQFTGPIPAELGNLTNLEYIDLSGNQLTGAIPESLGNLSKLEIMYLSGNQLTGPVPESLARLTGLRHLTIAGAGPVPSWLVNLTNLETLWINGDFTGAIPPELGSMTNLTGLGLSGTQLTGTIPPELGNLTNLERLSLNDSQLTGPIPPELGNLNNLEVLYLRDNQLTGPIPPELANLPNLVALYVRGNQLDKCLPLGLREKLSGGSDFHVSDGWMRAEECEAVAAAAWHPDREALEAFYHATGGPNWERNDGWLSDSPLRDWYGVNLDADGRVNQLTLQINGLRGQLPAELANLPYLTYLWLSGHQLTGQIPRSLGKMPRLEVLVLKGNQLTGQIPSELGNLTTLRVLSLSGNQLTGPIPPELGNVTSLTNIELQENQLTGNLPPELAALPNLQYLLLNDNLLSGSIPMELTSLTSLNSLWLTGNQFTGCIPPGLLFQMRGYYLDLPEC